MLIAVNFPLIPSVLCNKVKIADEKGVDSGFPQML